MKTRFALLLLCGVLLPLGRQANAQASPHPLLKLQPVPFTNVEISDSFWTPRREANRKVSLPHSLDMLEQSGNVHNFEITAKHAHTGYIGPVFMDSDAYKTIEAVSYSLATDPDPILEKRIDAMIAKIAAAQMPDGYLDTYYQVNEPERRWTNLRDNHEMYCAGHLMEAAVAHYEATGKKTLLNVAVKLADHISARFGDGPGQRQGYCGHPEIELALVKLWRVTGEKRYFNTAKYFINARGSHFFAKEGNTPEAQYDGTYWLDDMPLRDRKTIAGHAVRAGYLLSGATDVAGETNDPALLAMLNRVWRNTTQKKMYLTGGIGPSASNEGFTTDYDLPNLTAYQETCASVAMVMWNHRLNLLYGDARYADVMERTLYNGMLAGVSQNGLKFFYVNPLASRGNHHRADWFGCACCPPNEARTLAALGGYAYATSDKGLWVNLYIQGGVNADVAGRKVSLKVKTEYPWDSKIKLTVGLDKAAHFALALREPEWCEAPIVSVNGTAVASPAVERGYLMLDRDWKPGDVVDLGLPMPVRRVAANPDVKENIGQLAIMRGPLVYCVEGCDIGASLSTLALPADANLSPVKESTLLGGIVTLKGAGLATPEGDWSGGLYRTAPTPRRVAVTAIPYYAWDNRAPGEMRVWLPTSPPAPVGGGLARQAKVSLSYVSGYCQPQGINDGLEPASSSQQPAALCHWWPHKGGTEWAQYTWKTPVTVSGSSVYWFDDTGRGECRPPSGWHLLYKDGEAWKPVALTGKAAYAANLDRWNDIEFAPVTTTALRLEFQMQPQWAVGIHEWKVNGPDAE